MTAYAAADGPADLYQHKEIGIIVGSSAGGAYVFYGRTIARHMGKYLPGNPTFVAQVMDCAGRRSAANWHYNIAPRDGT